MKERDKERTGTVHPLMALSKQCHRITSETNLFKRNNFTYTRRNSPQHNTFYLAHFQKQPSQILVRRATKMHIIVMPHIQVL